MYSDVSDCILNLMIPETEPTSQRIPSFAEILVELSSRENIFTATSSALLAQISRR